MEYQTHRQCINCYRLHQNKRYPSHNNNEKQGETGAIFAQVYSNSSPHHPLRDTKNILVCHQSTHHLKTHQCRLDHIVFSKGQRRRSRFMDHPKVQLELSVLPSDYHHLCPSVSPTTIIALEDSGAQSCLWSLEEFLADGFRGTFQMSGLQQHQKLNVQNHKVPSNVP